MRPFTLAVLISCLLVFSCKKDSSLNHVANPTSYILKRQTWSGPVSNGESLAYFYNSDNLISRIERYQWGGGGTSQFWYDTGYYRFEYTNGLCTKWIIDDAFEGYFIYEYNNKKLPVKRTLYYKNNSPYGTCSFYKYDNSGNVIEKTDSSNKVNFRYSYTYNSDNNLVSATEQILWSTPQQKSKTDYLTFDNKINYIKAVNGLPLTANFDNNFQSYSSTSPNNFQSSNYYVQVNLDQPFGAPNSVNCSYEYNDQGLPTKMISGPWIVVYEYEKYK